MLIENEKPCPFCSNEMIIIDRETTRCPQCECNGPMKGINEDLDCEVSSYAQNLAISVKRWNTRFSLKEIDQNKKIKPCPFCGGEKICGPGQFLMCPDCWSEGPFFSMENAKNKIDLENKVLALWNKRSGEN